MRTPPFPPYPEWSTSRFFSFVRSALRGAFNRYPVKWKVLRKAQREYEGVDKRRKYEYQCACCGEWFKGSEVSVDHITPCGSLLSFSDIPIFAEKLFCSEDGLQVLCKECHRKKTNEERGIEH